MSAPGGEAELSAAPARPERPPIADASKKPVFQATRPVAILAANEQNQRIGWEALANQSGAGQPGSGK